MTMKPSKSLVPSTPDRSAQGKAERKLDLATRLQAKADEFAEAGDEERADFYQELADEAMELWRDMEADLGGAA